MELKFHIIIFVVLVVAFGIDAKWGGSRGSSSRGSWSRGSSSRGSSSRGSTSFGSSSSRGSSSHGNTWFGGSSSRGKQTSHPISTSKPNWLSSSKPSTTHNTGSSHTFLTSERGGGSSSVNRPSSSGSDPFRGASAPSLSHGSNTNNSPLRPFGTVPPPRHTGSNTKNSPLRPFGTVPPPRHTGSNTNNSPLRPFGTVPPPPIHHNNRPQTPPPPGFVIPPKHISVTQKTPITTRPTSRPVVRQPTQNHRNSTPNYGSPAPGFRRNVTSSFGGSSYPRQPAYYDPTQTYLQPQTVYPHGNIQPIHNHIYPQQGPVLPPNPAPTYVILPGQQSYSSSRQTGDIFKEALIHAGVNAAVHRLTAPSYYDHYHQNSWSNYGVPPSSHGSSVTTTHIVNNYYDQGSGGAPMISGGGGGSSFPSNYPAQNYPSISSGSSQPAPPPSVGYPTGNTGSNGNSGSQGTFVSPGNPNSGLPSNGISSPTQSNGQEQSNAIYNWPMAVSDEELWNITEKLFSMDENNAQKYITLNLQNKTTANSTNITDASPQPLFNIQHEAYQIQTVRAIRSLYQAASQVENKTRENSRKEEALLIDLLMNTNVMTVTMGFLEKKNLIGRDYYEQKESLKHIWFTPYDGSSSGFKRVFQGEIIGGNILYGIQDWIAFDFVEKSGRANYLSYTEKVELGKAPQTASILKLNYEIGGIKKNGTSLFIGTSPELELALYTICHYARPNNYCNIALGGTRFMLYTHTFRYFGADLIDLGLPVV